MVHHLRNVHWRNVLLVGYVVHMVQKCKKKTAVIENDSLVKEQHEGEEKPEASNFIFASTAMCDLCATTLNTFGITYLSSSIYQMFRGFELLFIVLFSKIFLKSTIYRHHILAVGFVITYFLRWSHCIYEPNER